MKVINMTLNNPIVERYKRYRSAGNKLNHKIIDAMMTEDTIKIAGVALGIKEKKKKILTLESENEADELMDFALYEVLIDGKNLVTHYANKIGGSSRTERDLLTAMGIAHPGLFRVIAIRPTSFQVEMEEVIGHERILKLTDLGLSQSIEKEIILFFRPIALAECTMTSGVGFPFPSTMEKELIEIWHTLSAGERYAKYFKLSHHSGISMGYWPI
jgi:hypothetical protein